MNVLVRVAPKFGLKNRTLEQLIQWAKINDSIEIEDEELFFVPELAESHLDKAGRKILGKKNYENSTYPRGNLLQMCIDAQTAIEAEEAAEIERQKLAKLIWKDPSNFTAFWTDFIEKYCDGKVTGEGIPIIDVVTLLFTNHNLTPKLPKNPGMIKVNVTGDELGALFKFMSTDFYSYDNFEQIGSIVISRFKNKQNKEMELKTITNPLSKPKTKKIDHFADYVKAMIQKHKSKSKAINLE
jgi:hypothetical protein